MPTGVVADISQLQRPWRPQSLYQNLPMIAGQVMNQEEDDPYRRMLTEMGSNAIERGGASTRAAELQSRISTAQRGGGPAPTNKLQSMIPSEANSALQPGGQSGFANSYISRLSEISKMGTAATARQQAINNFRNQSSGGGGGGDLGSYTGSATGRRLALINAAKRWLGTPYSWGGGGLSGPTRGIAQGRNTVGFDCSGLVRMAYARVGIKMPRVSQAQMTRGVRTSIRNLQPGDLVGKGYPAHHIAIYMGNGRIIEAQQTGTRVHIRNIGNGAGWWGIHVKI